MRSDASESADEMPAHLLDDDVVKSGTSSSWSKESRKTLKLCPSMSSGGDEAKGSEYVGNVWGTKVW